MQQNNQETYSYQTNEIDLRKIAKSLKERKWFIFGFTSFVTLLTIVSLLSLPSSPIEYIAKTSFLQPTNNSILSLNKSGFLNETNKTVYSSFLSNINKKTLQKKVFIEGNYLTRLDKENEPIDEVDKYISSFLHSINIDLFQTNIYDQATILSIRGTNPLILIDFLNDLVDKANKETISQYINLIDKKISHRLEEISSERQLILLRAKQERLNEIVILSDAAKIAQSLGIIENNFNQLGDDIRKLTEDLNSANLLIAPREDNKLPIWFLYGEKALLERVKFLSNRNVDDAYIPELVTLSLEKYQLESLIVESDNINAIELTQSASSKKIQEKSRNKLILTLSAFFAGLMLSILLSLIMNLFKEDETQPSKKTSR